LSFGGNTATANINIKAGSSISELSRLEQGTKKFDTALTTSGRNAQNTANLITTSIRKVDPALASSAKSNLAFGASFEKVNQAVQKNQTSLTALGNNYKQLDATQTKMGRNLNLSTSSFNAMGKSADTTGSKMSKMGGFMKNNLTNVSLLAGGIAGLDDQFHRVTKAQVGYERAQLMQDKVSQRIQKTEEALNKMREKGLTGTADYALKLKDLELAKEQEGIMSERASVAQTTLNEATEDFYVGILPNLIFVGGSAASLIKDMGIKSSTLKGIIPGLGKAFGGLGGAIGGLGGAFTSLGSAMKNLNWSSILLSAGAIAGPILAGVAAIWLLVGAYQGLSNVSADIIEANNLQIDSLNSLQLTYLSIQDTLSNMNLAPKLTAREKHNLDEYNKITKDKMEELVQTAKDKNKDMWGSFGKGFFTVPPQIKAGLTNLKSQFGDIFDSEVPEDVLGLEEGVTQPATEAFQIVDQATVALTKLKNLGGFEGLTDKGPTLGKGPDIAKFEQNIASQIGPAVTRGEQLGLMGTPKLGERTLKQYELYLSEGSGRIQKSSEAVSKTIMEEVNSTGKLVGTRAEVEAMEKRATATKEKLLGQWQEQIDLEDQASKQTAQTKKDQSELIGIEAELTKAFQEKTTVQGLDGDQVKKLTDIAHARTNQIEGEEQSLAELAVTEGVHITNMKELITNKKDDTTVMKQQLAAHIKWDEALKSSTKQQALLQDGNLKATQRLQEFSNGLVSGYAESNKYRSGLEVIVSGLYPLIKTVDLTTSQLEQLAQRGFQNSGDEMAEWAQRMNSLKDSARGGILSGIIGSEDNKAFKNAWKELDLGDVPKSLRDDFKKILKEEQKLGEESIELQTSIQGLNLSMDGLSDNEIDKWLDKIGTEFEDWGKKMGGYEAELANNDKLMAHINDTANKGDKVWTAFTEAMQDGNITLDEKVDILAALGEETGNAIDPTKDLSDEQTKIAENNLLARTIDQVTTNIESQTTALDAATKSWGSYNQIKGDSYGDNSFGDGDCIDDYGRKVSCSGSGKILPYKGNNPKTKKMPKGNEADIANNTPWGSWSVAFGSGGADDPITKIQTLQKALDSLRNYGVKNLAALAKASSTNMSGFSKNINVGTTATQTIQIAIGSLTKYGNKNLSALAKASSTNMKGFSNNTDVGTEAIQTLQTAIGSLAKYGARNLAALAKASSKNMNGFVNNIEEGINAVQDLQSAIDGLKDKTVNVTVNRQDKGGVYSFAEGGIVSASSGKITTTVGPTMFLYGDNPGGKETLAFIPHNNPMPTLEKLTAMFSNELSGNFTNQGIGNGKGTVLHIHNHYLERDVQQVINVERGRMINRMGG
jgi:hypothetical protein